MKAEEKKPPEKTRSQLIAAQLMNFALLICIGGALAGVATWTIKPMGMLTGISLAWLCKLMAGYAERVIKLCKTKQYQIS